MKFCTKCGNSIVANAKFCTKCGNTIDDINNDNEIKIPKEFFGGNEEYYRTESIEDSIVNNHIDKNIDFNNSSNVNSSDVNSDSNMTTSQKRPIGVAILDTGIYRHIDFDNRIIAFVDFVNGQVMPYDDNGHGSHVRYRYTH